jgi:hypothetical protein
MHQLGWFFNFYHIRITHLIGWEERKSWYYFAIYILKCPFLLECFAHFSKDFKDVLFLDVDEDFLTSWVCEGGMKIGLGIIVGICGAERVF